MKVAALALGLIGGFFAIMIGLFGYSVGGIAGAVGASGAGVYQLVSMAIPVAGLVGAALSMNKPEVAGVLMLLSALGLLAVFGLNFFTLIPALLSGLGGVLCFAAIAAATAQEGGSKAHSARPTNAASSALNATPVVRPIYDKERFEALVKYDEEIKTAVDQVRPLGNRWMEELAREFLTVNDKAYLAKIVETIQEKASNKREKVVTPSDVVEEGVHLNRRWRRYKNGVIEWQTISTSDEAS